MSARPTISPPLNCRTTCSGPRPHGHCPCGHTLRHALQTRLLRVLQVAFEPLRRRHAPAGTPSTLPTRTCTQPPPTAGSRTSRRCRSTRCPTTRTTRAVTRTGAHAGPSVGPLAWKARRAVCVPIMLAWAEGDEPPPPIALLHAAHRQEVQGEDGRARPVVDDREGDGSEAKGASSMPPPPLLGSAPLGAFISAPCSACSRTLQAHCGPARGRLSLGGCRRCARTPLAAPELTHRFLPPPRAARVRASEGANHGP